jgi:hypothetical protein
VISDRDGGEDRHCSRSTLISPVIAGRQVPDRIADLILEAGGRSG